MPHILAFACVLCAVNAKSQNPQNDKIQNAESTLRCGKDYSYNMHLSASESARKYQSFRETTHFGGRILIFATHDFAIVAPVERRWIARDRNIEREGGKGVWWNCVLHTQKISAGPITDDRVNSQSRVVRSLSVVENIFLLVCCY